MLDLFFNKNNFNSFVNVSAPCCTSKRKAGHIQPHLVAQTPFTDWYITFEMLNTL